MPDVSDADRKAAAEYGDVVGILTKAEMRRMIAEGARRAGTVAKAFKP